MDEPETRAGAEAATPSKDSNPTSIAETDSSVGHPKSSSDAAPDATGQANADGQQPSAKQPRKGISGWLWAAIIVGLLAGELYAYGHNGEVRVCVGRKAITDFTQLDKPRKGNIAAGYPFCVEHLNLGMYSRSDDVAREALDVACGRAATLLRGDKTECIRRDKDWIRRVDKHTIPPWDPRLYKRLFFIE